MWLSNAMRHVCNYIQVKFRFTIIETLFGVVPINYLVYGSISLLSCYCIWQTAIFQSWIGTKHQMKHLTWKANGKHIGEFAQFTVSKCRYVVYRGRKVRLNAHFVFLLVLMNNSFFALFRHRWLCQCPVPQWRRLSRRRQNIHLWLRGRLQWKRLLQW